MRKGFTLMELLIVIAILGIMSVMIVNMVRSANPQARDIRRKQNLEAIQKALEMYYSDNDAYPQSLPTLVPNSGKKYFGKLPSDPISGNTYVYIQGTGGTSYRLYSCLEITPTAAPSFQGGSVGCCADSPYPCYYGVASTGETP